MNTHRRTLVTAALLLSSASFVGGEPSTAQTTLVIKGMTCGGCVAAVKVQLKKTPGVSAYQVSLEKGEAAVTYDPSRTDPKKIAESVSKTGFEATVKGETKAEAQGDGTPVATLDLAKFREWFNRSSGSVRIVSLLSPT
jgi:copper chaperone